MRTRTIMTVAILSAGCGTSGTTRQAPASGPTAPAAPATVATTTTTAPAPTTTVLAVPAPVTAAAAPMATNDPAALQRLATELRAAAPADVSARLTHFRPLCDAEGFPLVGNLVTKSMSPESRPITAFCADVRTRAGR